MAHRQILDTCMSEAHCPIHYWFDVYAMFLNFGSSIRRWINDTHAFLPGFRYSTVTLFFQRMFYGSNGFSLDGDRI